jgi:hypothetical protein
MPTYRIRLVTADRVHSLPRVYAGLENARAVAQACLEHNPAFELAALYGASGQHALNVWPVVKQEAEEEERG